MSASDTKVSSCAIDLPPIESSMACETSNGVDMLTGLNMLTGP